MDPLGRAMIFPQENSVWKFIKYVMLGQYRRIHKFIDSTYIMSPLPNNLLPILSLIGCNIFHKKIHLPSYYPAR